MQTEIYQESAVLVGLITPHQPEERAREYLDELAFLADTAGATPVKFFVQKLDYPNPKTFVGPGKLKEIKEYLVAHDIGLVIFDDELSPGQLRNIERELNVLILDRTNLILDIFAKRAQTANAKTQVELSCYTCCPAFPVCGPTSSGNREVSECAGREKLRLKPTAV